MLKNNLDLKELENNDIDFDYKDNITITNFSNLPYPTIDRNAKWKLQDIFIKELEEPGYLMDFINANN